jgi:hypothetical protein
MNITLTTKTNIIIMSNKLFSRFFKNIIHLTSSSLNELINITNILFNITINPYFHLSNLNGEYFMLFVIENDSANE